MAQSVVKRGSVVLIRYPFTDLTGSKVRPTLVVNGDRRADRFCAQPRMLPAASSFRKRISGSTRKAPSFNSAVPV